MAKKAKSKAKTKKEWTAELILEDWKKAVKSGLGARKKLSTATVNAFEPILKKAIKKRLAEGGDYAKEGANTRAVAKVVGRFCAALVLGNEISKAVFEDVFTACQHHHLCPTSTSSGSGKWCDI
jgi:hypothetical protein